MDASNGDSHDWCGALVVPTGASVDASLARLRVSVRILDTVLIDGDAAAAAGGSSGDRLVAASVHQSDPLTHFHCGHVLPLSVLTLLT